MSRQRGGEDRRHSVPVANDSGEWAVPPPADGQVEHWAPPEDAGQWDSGTDDRAPADGQVEHWAPPEDAGQWDSGTDDRAPAGADDSAPASGTDRVGTSGDAGLQRRPARGRAPRDRRRQAKRLRAEQRPVSSSRLLPQPPGTRRFLVLGEGYLSDDVAALDLASGVLVRLSGGLPVLPDATVQPFDVVDGVVSAPGAADDPSRPEAILVAGQLSRAGVVRGRKVRRRLRSMVAPAEPHLLGFAGTTWPYWELRGERPSVAIVTPSRGPMLFRRAEDDTAWIRFGWYRTDNWLPLQDRRAVAALQASGKRRLTGKALVTALGFRPAYLVVAVGRPRDGYCTKSVLALLPRS